MYIIRQSGSIIKVRIWGKVFRVRARTSRFIQKLYIGKSQDKTKNESQDNTTTTRQDQTRQDETRQPEDKKTHKMT